MTHVIQLPVDQLKRPIRDIRISVTDRCNFRCVYCMPRETFGKDHKFLPRKELLQFEEIERVVRIFADLGVRKVRLTGGEPLVRAHLETLIEKIAVVPGIEDVSLTTNASLLSAKRAQSLKDAGINRINISLDTMDNDMFMAINDVKVTVDQVLEGIANASGVGFDSVKINMVVKKGLNDNSILPMIRYFHGSGQILRFIEYMDVGNSNSWQLNEVLTAKEIVDMIHQEFPLEMAEPNYSGEVAKRWKFADGGGEIGVISSVSQPFCGDCSRIRLSAVGRLYTCLFAHEGHDMRQLLRSEVDDQQLTDWVTNLWQLRSDRYSETRNHVHVIRPMKVEMSYIGG